MFARLALASLLVQGCVPRLYSEAPAGDWEAPENDWPLSEPPADLVAEGYDVGEVVPDFRLPDQHGQTVSLWQFYGQVVVIDISTLWCAPCRELAEYTEETWLEYKDEGFVYVTLIAEDLESQAPDQEDLTAWADAFGISAPVVGDDDQKSWSTDPVSANANSYPVVLVVDREMVVTARLTADDAAIRAAIEDAL